MQVNELIRVSTPKPLTNVIDAGDVVDVEVREPVEGIENTITDERTLRAYKDGIKEGIRIRQTKINALKKELRRLNKKFEMIRLGQQKQV